MKLFSISVLIIFVIILCFQIFSTISQALKYNDNVSKLKHTQSVTNSFFTATGNNNKSFLNNAYNINPKIMGFTNSKINCEFDTEKEFKDFIVTKYSKHNANYNKLFSANFLTSQKKCYFQLFIKLKILPSMCICKKCNLGSLIPNDINFYECIASFATTTKTLLVNNDKINNDTQNSIKNKSQSNYSVSIRSKRKNTNNLQKILHLPLNHEYKYLQSNASLSITPIIKNLTNNAKSISNTQMGFYILLQGFRSDDIKNKSKRKKRSLQRDILEANDNYYIEQKTEQTNTNNSNLYSHFYSFILLIYDMIRAIINSDSILHQILFTNNTARMLKPPLLSVKLDAINNTFYIGKKFYLSNNNNKRRSSQETINTSSFKNFLQDYLHQVLPTSITRPVKKNFSTTVNITSNNEFSDFVNVNRLSNNRKKQDKEPYYSSRQGIQNIPDFVMAGFLDFLQNGRKTSDMQ